ncbi:MAG: hypothetical protein P4L49_16485 [Desulfosporosinus sp.]|nr:hypothetical protein [Desulfosporosinus sp.]
MKIVGIEEHFLTKSVRNAWSTLTVANQDSGQDLHMEEVEKRLDDLSDGRIRLMDESGVDVQCRFYHSLHLACTTLIVSKVLT